MAMSLRVVVPPHPLIAHWLTMLRNSGTPGPLYGKSLEELGKWLTYEALRDWLPHRNEEVNTTQGITVGTVVESSIPLIALPSIPGGLELWQGGRLVLPNASVCIGGIPNFIEENAGIIIYEDQVPDGTVLLKKLEVLNKQGVESKRIRVITALTAKPGLQKIGEKIPDLNIYCACIDPEITDNGEINPGIGNPSLRLNSKIAGPNFP